MALRVRILGEALQDIAEASAKIAEDSPSAARQWYRALRTKISDLSEMPRRYALAPEAEELGSELRQFHHYSHRVIFRVRNDAVEILRVYHGARHALG